VRQFRDAVQSGNFSISAELTLKKESTAKDVCRQVDGLGELVDGVQVIDNPWSWIQMSAVSAASLLLGMDVDPITVMNCRDRNRIALQSDLVGLRAMGVTSLVLKRGQHIPKDHQEQASAVFDTSSRELVSMASELNEDPFIDPTEKFFIGTEARAFRPGNNWRAESLKVRSKAGARFLQTQLCFNTKIVRKYIDALVREKLTWKYSVIVSLAVLPSVDTVIWLMKNVPDSKIPVSLGKRIESATDPVREGVNVCVELMQELSEIPGVSGVNLLTMGDSESIVKAIKASGLRA